MEARTDAKAVAEAAAGVGKAPLARREGSIAAQSWRSIILYCDKAARAGVSWRGAQPVAWTPRGFNGAADRLAALTRAGPVDWAVGAAALHGWASGPEVRVRIFSDASRTEGHVTWAALVFVEVRRLWRLAAAASGRLASCTSVPAAEWVAAAQGWRLEAVTRRRAQTSSAGSSGGGARIGRPLAGAEVYWLELLTNLAWAQAPRGE